VPGDVAADRPFETPGPIMRLLYIEDNSSNIALMQHLIAHRPQWRMVTAKGGAAGLELAATTAPNMVLLDLHLPDMDGIDVLHRLQADPLTSDLRVVIVSADASPSQMNRLLAAGAQEYLTKPLDVQRALELLDTFAAESTGSKV
jgi:CheY-like chemotaxis protein